MTALLARGDEIARMEQVTGEEGISLDDFVLSQTAGFIDMVFLQQDAFDEIDASAPLARQKALFDRNHAIATRSYGFADKATARSHFTRLTGLFKNLNSAAVASPDFGRLSAEIEALRRRRARSGADLTRRLFRRRRIVSDVA